MQHVTPLDCSRIAQDLQIRKVQVEAVVQLLDEGNTVPFITRYRKERTGGLNEEAIRQIQARVTFLRQLADRKQTILRSIETQGRLTDELRDAILRADTTKRLEDLYLPYKPKKRSLASTARERGLEPLAHAVWFSDQAITSLDEVVPNLVNPEKGLNTAEDVRLGVMHILAEMIAETAEVRAAVRQVLWETGEIHAAKSDKVGEGQGLEFKGYFQFKEAARQIPPHRILAINRGEKEGVLKVRLEWQQERARQNALHPLAEHLLKVVGQTPPPPPAPPAEPTAAPDAAAPPVAEEHPPALTSDVGLAMTGEIPPAAEAHPHHGEAPHAEQPAAPPAPAEPPSAPLVASLTPGEPRPPVTLTGEPLVVEIEFRSPHAEFLKQALDDALQRLLGPSLEREVRGELTDEAEGHAVSVFARNLRSLLLQPPMHAKRVLAVDPGRGACKLAALDEYGNLLESLVIHPFGGGGKKRERKGPAAQEQAPAPEAAPAAPVAEAAGGEPASPLEPISEAAGAEPVAPEVVAGPPETPPPAPEVPPSEQPSVPAPEAAAQAPPSPPAEAAPPRDRRAEAKTQLRELVAQHNLDVVALGNGTGCRETEELISELIAEALPQLAYVIVNEAGASVYSVSAVAREEFPQHDATVRSAVSIGRRLQDPLSELVKVDPQNVGVGLYQHDVSHKHLKESLEGVVESCVNQVGVDLNTASVPLLRYVSGLNQLVARELVEHRKQHGPFTSREQLLQVPGVGPQRYVQAAGFLKVPAGGNPLDRTWIHPESYDIAEKILAELGTTPAALDEKAAREELQAKLRGVNVEELARKVGAGAPTVHDILEALARPGRDPREDLPPPIFKKGILKIEDLQPGMELKGTVLNVVDFGAFVDVGLKDSGLVHISQMANRYIKSPYDVVAVNDVVTVWVLGVDKDRHHVSLTMIKPGTERKPLERRPPQQGGRPPQGRRPGAPQPAGAAAGTGAGGPPGAGERSGRPPGRGRGGPPPGRGPRGPRPGQPAAAPAGAAAEGGAARTPPPPPPPRKPRREPPKPKLTQAAIEGKVPLRTFSELSALFAVRKDDDKPTPAAPHEETPPSAEAPPADPAGGTEEHAQGS